MKILFLLFIVIGIVQSRKGFGPGEQDWDFVQVRPGAYMFWWLYYTTDNVPKPEDKPLLIWLQGGPGGSSTGFGNFLELGPLDGDLKPRNTTWVKYYNVLFIDNPVGTGFSYVNDSSKLAVNNNQIALDLIECLRSFYQRLPEFESTPLYITAESYGGKMTAEFALELNKVIIQGKIKSNLKGVMLVGAWIYPIYFVTTWAPYLLNLGFVDNKGFNLINNSAQICQKLLDEEQYKAATACFFATIDVIMQTTDDIDIYNVLNRQPFSSKLIEAKQHMEIYSILPPEGNLTDIMNVQVREALNISDDIVWVETDRMVFEALANDFMRPIAHIVETLLNTTNLKVFVVSGQLDLAANNIGAYKWVSELKFNNRKIWNTAQRRALIVNDYIEGYVKAIENFAFYWIDRSGHMVPTDNPLAILKILEYFTSS